MMIYKYFAFAGESSLLTDGLTPADIKVHTQMHNTNTWLLITYIFRAYSFLDIVYRLNVIQHLPFPTKHLNRWHNSIYSRICLGAVLPPWKAGAHTCLPGAAWEALPCLLHQVKRTFKYLGTDWSQLGHFQNCCNLMFSIQVNLYILEQVILVLKLLLTRFYHCSGWMWK